MKLIELNPRWVNYKNQKLGVTFDCPHCKAQRLGVAFQHQGLEHLESNLILAVSPNTKIWTEINPEPDTFDNLTLVPSVDCSASGHWHGHIENGVIK